MKILVLNNIYPPMQIGGYEQLCRDVVEGLRGRGHHVTVLTSNCGVPAPTPECDILRWLRLEREFYGWKSPGALRSVVHNFFAFRRALAVVAPDLVFIWNLENVGHPIMRQAAACRRKVLYHLGSPWLLLDDVPTFLLREKANAPLLNVVRRVLRPIAERIGLFNLSSDLTVPNAIFSCTALKDMVLGGDIKVGSDFVVHEGIPVDTLPLRDFDIHPAEPELKLLYAGQLVRHKGPHTAILAMGELLRQGQADLQLTLIGTGEPEYIASLHRLVTELRLESHVVFWDPVPRELIGSVVVEHDVLIFPSIWEEPWSLMLLIGMACGVGVVSTATGGSAEVLEDNVNALVFPPDDSVELARQILKLHKNRFLLKKLGTAASERVRSSFGISTMVEKIDNILHALGGD